MKIIIFTAILVIAVLSFGAWQDYENNPIRNCPSTVSDTNVTFYNCQNGNTYYSEPN